MSELTVYGPYLKECLDYIRLINSHPLEQIVWKDEMGKSYNVKKKDLEEWKFTGLSNKDFYEMVICPS